MRFSAALGALVALTIAAAAFAPAPAEAAFPGKNGKITFAFINPYSCTASFRSMEPDGSGIAEVASGGGLVSPDGKKIASVGQPVGDVCFSDGSPATAFGKAIFVTNENGKGKKQIASFPSDNPPHSLAWSPDGQKVAFVVTPLSNLNSDPPYDFELRPWADEIWVANADGTDTRKIRAGEGTLITGLSWSPDGETLAATARSIIATADYPQGYVFDPKLRIYLLNADGVGGLRRLTKGEGNAARADWSPDGKSIVFARSNSNPSVSPDTEVYIVDVKSGQQRRVTENEVWDGAPHWSPDGGSILFSSRRDAVPFSDPSQFNGTFTSSDLYLYDVDSGATERLTTMGPERGTGIAHWQSLNVAPVLGRVAVVPGRFLPTTTRAKAAKVRLTLSEFATVKIVVKRRGKTVGSFERDVVPGANTILFNGRLRNKNLSAGTYTLAVVARDPLGKASVTRTARFAIGAPAGFTGRK